MIENEVWKDIRGYEGLYQISNYGRVKSLSRFRNNRYGGYWTKEIIMRSADDGGGYLIIILSKNGIRKHYKIHRLVAEAFIPNDDPINKTQVNHIKEFEK